MKMLSLIFAILTMLWLLWPSPAGATDNYAIGYRTPAGYVYQGNAVWQWPATGALYTRDLVYSPGYTSYGVYYAASSIYRYLPYSPPVTAYVAPKAPPVTDVRLALIEVKKDMLRQEYAIVKRQEEAAEISALIKELGLQGNPVAMRYAQSYAGPYTTSGSFYSTIAPATATTAYGYSLKQVLDSVYGDDTLAAAGQRAAQAGQIFQNLAAQAQQTEADKQTMKARQVELITKHMFALEMMRAINTPTSVETKGFTFRIEPGGVLQRDDAKVPAAAKEKLSQALGDLLASKCAGCHFGEKAKGKFDVSNYFSMSQQEKQSRVWPRIISTADPKDRMPQAEGGGPGVPLTAAEIQLFLTN